MPGAQERVLRRRISSVQNTKKITRAFELIAATRVVKAQQAANEARPYSHHITKVIGDLAAAGASRDHALLRQPEEVNTVGMVVLAGDRGLAGAYNSTVIRAAEREIMAIREAGQRYVLVTVGRKAESYFRFRGYEITRAFTGMSDKPTYEDAGEVAATVSELFAGEVDRVDLAFTRFISMGTQRVTVRRFLPLETEPEDPSDAAAPAQTAQTRSEAATVAASAQTQFEFEPSPTGVLEALLPRYVEARLFSALLDAAASEHAGRQRAMKSATDNAQELILKYTRKMNQARQDAITTEIMEIIGGAEALGAEVGVDESLILDHMAEDAFPLHLFTEQRGHVHTHQPRHVH